VVPLRWTVGSAAGRGGAYPVNPPLSRRDFCRTAATAITALTLPPPLTACMRPTPDEVRLAAWTAALRAAGLVRHEAALGRAAVRVGEEARGTPYRPGTLDAYLRAGGSPQREPLTVSLTRFDCVTLVESCLAVARVAGSGQPPTWERFGREIERMRYRGGKRRGYASRCTISASGSATAPGEAWCAISGRSSAAPRTFDRFGS
jgi:Protein of unknown function (DUF1460).